MKKRQKATYIHVLLGLGLVFFLATFGGFLFHYSAPPENTTTPNPQRETHLDDASNLNKTVIFRRVEVTNEAQIKATLQFAKKNHLNVSIAGKRHSMGGQTLSHGGIVLDMTRFNKITLNKQKKTLTAQSGATWAQVQTLVDQMGLSVKAMQSINAFTIGGSLSVNAHGIAHNPGPLASTVRSLRVMVANGEIKVASPTENPELFRLVLGGYGLFGVILDAEIQLTDNAVYKRNLAFMNYKDFPAFFINHVYSNPTVDLFYGRISVSPTSYLSEVSAYTYEKIAFKGKIPRLMSEKHIWLQRLIFNISKTGACGRWLRWILEKHLEPKTHIYIENNLVSRNQEMFDAMAYLQHRLKGTDILQEYFIPVEKMPLFVDGLRSILKKNGANLLNITIRFVHKDTVTALPYAKEDYLAFVLYFNRKATPKEEKILQKTTTALVELTTNLNGTFYLPYQLYYSVNQLRKAYPEIRYFFEAKTKLDPDGLFSNKFYEKYRPHTNPRNPIK